MSETVTVDLGGRPVAVPAGGLHDHYRMDTDLDAPIKTIQLDVVTEGQLALHLPVPISIQAR